MRNRQQGQVLAYGLAALLIGAAALVLLYNAGQTSTEKTRTVNAADAAAFSGGIWVARQLNFMAYTNRAMVANHVAVGHFVSYMSWIRYVEDSSEKLRDLTRFIPYINVATRILATWGAYVRSGTEYFADVFIPATDTLNRALHAAQLAAKANMLGVVGAGGFTPLHEIMEVTAKRYHPEMRVNDPDDLATLTGAVSGLQVVDEMLRIYSFSKRYDPASDEGMIKSLVESSLASSRGWIEGDRGWTKCLLIACGRLPGNIKAGKSGSTEHSENEGKLGWEAQDELGIWKAKRKRRSTSYRWSGGIVAEGSATAAEFSDSYAGIHSYYALENPDAENQSLHLSAYVTLPVAEARMKPLLGMDASEDRLAALSRVEIFHARPNAFGGDDEYANLFNPYWRARLSRYGSFLDF